MTSLALPALFACTSVLVWGPRRDDGSTRVDAAVSFTAERMTGRVLRVLASAGLSPPAWTAC
ncbi:MAG TPA: hypothetical protein VH478_14475 [Trebonia sp.]|nr:hypothetical protein [Trebonia sp.]